MTAQVPPWVPPQDSCFIKLLLFIHVPVCQMQTVYIVTPAVSHIVFGAREPDAETLYEFTWLLVLVSLMRKLL